MEDIYDIERFLTAQDTFSSSYNIALNEIKNGHKALIGYGIFSRMSKD